MERVKHLKLSRPSLFLGKLREKIERENRIYILPTVIGYYFIGIIFVLLLISLSYGHSLAFTATFLFISMVMVSAIITHYNLYGIEVMSVNQNMAAFEGSENVELEISFKNKSGKVKFDIYSSLGPHKSEVISRIGSEQVMKFKTSIDDLKRGKYLFHRIEVQTEFPFSLFRAWKVFKLNTEIWVYPKISTSLALPDSKKISRQDDDFYNEKFESSMSDHFDEFKEHRFFRENDSWKLIDWKVYARTQDLLIKTFESSQGQMINFDDYSFRQYLQLDMEDKISILATWFYSAHLLGIQYECSISEFNLKEIKSNNQEILTEKLLKHLSLVA